MPAAPHTDPELMLRVQVGDTGAFRALYDRHSAAAFGLALAMTRNRRLAEDAVQEAFLTVWRARASYDPERGSVGGWILTIARSRALDTLRRARRSERAWEPLDDHDVADDALEAPDEHASRGEERRAVRAAFAHLPADQATALGLAYFAGLTQAEIAQRLELPLGTVKGRIRLGLARLAGELSAAPV
jgi:RNA polymerase sigma-70 factor, ECF subfamily